MGSEDEERKVKGDKTEMEKNEVGKERQQQGHGKTNRTEDLTSQEQPYGTVTLLPPPRHTSLASVVLSPLSVSLHSGLTRSLSVPFVHPSFVSRRRGGTTGRRERRDR